MLSDPAFVAVAVLAVLLIGISKSGFGGAMGSLSVPLLSLLIATPQAAAIMLPIMLVLDAIGLVVFRGQGDQANLRIIIPGGMVGIVLGALTFQLVDSRWIKAVIGVEALLFGVDRLRQVHRDGGASNAPALAKGLFWSSVSGFTSTGRPTTASRTGRLVSIHRFMVSQNTIRGRTHWSRTAACTAGSQLARKTYSESRYAGGRTGLNPSITLRETETVSASFRRITFLYELSSVHMVLCAGRSERQRSSFCSFSIQMRCTIR